MGCRFLGKNSTAIIIVSVLIAVIFGAFVGSLVGRIAAPVTNGSSLEYKDFVSIMLTAISILMALVTLIISVLAVFGWKFIEDKAKESTKVYLEAGFENGDHLHTLLNKQVTTETKNIFTNLKVGDPLHLLIGNEVREIMFQGVRNEDDTNFNPEDK